jgi:hypothetical protein
MGYKFTMSLQTLNERDLEKLERLKDNLDWFYSNHEYFKKYHKRQYVAIKDRIFLDEDIELDRLVKRLKIKDFDDSIVIEFVHG